MQEAQEFATEGGEKADSDGKVLPRGSSGGDLVWSGYMGAFGTNDSEVRGSACGFPVAVHTKTGNPAEGWVLAACDGENSPTGSGGTADSDICGQVTGYRRFWRTGWPYGLFLTFVQEIRVMRKGGDSGCCGGGRHHQRSS